MARGTSGARGGGLGSLFVVAFLGGGAWERLGFAGVRALLFTWLVIQQGGTYGEVVPLLALLWLLPGAGGFVVERVGVRWALVVGAALEAVGMALLGMALVLPAVLAIGVGGALLKPAVFAAAPRAHREATFTLLYMGASTGAFAVPMVALVLAGTLGWGWGCGVAAAASALAALVALTVGLGDEPTTVPALIAPPPVLDEDQLDTLPPAERFRSLGADTGGATAPMAEREAAPVMVDEPDLAYSGAVAAARSPLGGSLLLLGVAAVFWMGVERVGVAQLAMASGLLDASSLWVLAINPLVLAVGAPLLIRLWLRRVPPVRLLLAGGLLLLAVSLGLGLLPGAAEVAWYAVTGAELLLVPVGLAAVVRRAPTPHAARWAGLWMGAGGAGVLLGHATWSTLGSDLSAVVLGGVAVVVAVALVLRPLGRLLES